MTSLIILANNLQGVNKNPSNLKNFDVDNEKDFSQILEGERKKQNNTIVDYKHKVKPFAEEKIKEENTVEKEMDIRSEEGHKSIGELEDEISPIFNSILNLLFTLNPLSEEFNEMDIENLNTEIKKATTILGELILQKGLSFAYEDYENIFEIFEYIDGLVQTIEKELNIENEWIEEGFIEFKDNFDGLKEMLESKIPITYGDTQGVDEYQIDCEGEENSINLDQGQAEKIDFDETSTTEKELSKKDEPSIENVADIIDEANIEDVESNTPVLQIESRIVLEPNPKILDKEFEEIDKKMVFEQIVEKAKLIVDDNKQEIRIKLKPEILGELILKMEVEKGSLLAKVLVDNYRTKELLEANLYQFKEEMKDNGLEIKTFEVFVGTNEDFERENRKEFYLNKKPSKLKIKNNRSKGIEIYDEAPTRTIQRSYHEGQLNLFA